MPERADRRSARLSRSSASIRVRRRRHGGGLVGVVRCGLRRPHSPRPRPNDLGRDRPPRLRPARPRPRRDVSAGIVGGNFAEPAMTERRIGYRWTILALLFVATTINYVDRQVLGILAPDRKSVV